MFTIPDCRYMDDDYAAEYVVKKCRELMIDPDALGVCWYRDQAGVIAVALTNLPVKGRAKGKLLAALVKLFDDTTKTPDFWVSDIVIDHMDNHIRIYLTQPSLAAEKSSL